MVATYRARAFSGIDELVVAVTGEYSSVGIRAAWTS